MEKEKRDRAELRNNLEVFLFSLTFFLLIGAFFISNSII